MITQSFSIPAVNPSTNAGSHFTTGPFSTQCRKLLPQVETVTSKERLLQPNPFGKAADILSVNFLSGSAQQCGFFLTPPGCRVDGNYVIQMHESPAKHLAAELAATTLRPRAVHVCPGSDPFLPPLDVQKQTAKVIGVLAESRIQTWLMTRGFIRPWVTDVLAEHKSCVNVMMGMFTLDQAIRRTFEPMAAPAHLRLKQIKKLIDRGVAVHVALEPLIPGLTDTRRNVLPLLEWLAEAGVQRVTTGYVFLAENEIESMCNRLKPFGGDAEFESAFRDGFVQRAYRSGRIRFLSKSRRQTGYAQLMALAAQFGISVSISTLSNPDFSRPTPGKVFVQPKFLSTA